MNRPAVFEQLVGVNGALELMTWFISNEGDDDKVRVEIDARCAQIETRLATIRGALASGRVESNVRTLHTTGNRGGDAA